MINIRNQEIITALGVRVKSLRKSQGLTMEKLCELAGIDSRQLGYIEHGQTNATVSTLFALSKALGISLQELIDFYPLNKI